MKLSQFKLKIPQELVAQYPSLYREDARMIVVHRKTGEIEHRLVKNVVDYFDEKDLFIFNDTKVFPARMFSKKEKTMADIEVFLLRELNPALRYWDVLVDPARKIRIGNKLFFDDDNTIVAEVVDNTTQRGRTLRFLTDYEGEDFIKHLYDMGVAPLPKYINRPMDESTLAEFKEVFHIEDDEDANACVRSMDLERYQSIFATKIGAVAAPASCMHFSKQLLKRMEIVGIEHAFLTSHVGLGNFKKIDVEDLSKHKVDSEQIIIEENLVNKVNEAHTANRHVCAVGTEVMRALEHTVGASGQLKVYNGWTNKFIYPPYDFTVADSFFTNLYDSQSSQLIMVAAFGGYDTIMNAYHAAIHEGYRFGDYGDAMLVID